MKRFFSTRFFSFVIVFVLLALAVPLVAVSASATTYIKNPSSANGGDYTDSAALAAMLDGVFSGDVDVYSNSGCTKEVSMPIGTNMSNDTKYYVKSKTTGNNVSGWQCYIYANAVYNKLFNEWVGHGTSFSHSEVVVSGGSNTVSYDTLKNAGVRCGAYMRTTNKSGGAYNGNAGHSLIILSYDSKSINYLEGNGDGKGLIRIVNKTWSEFNAGQLSGRGRYVSHIVQPTASYYDSLYPDTVQERAPRIYTWVSEKGGGYSADAATAASTGVTGTRYYYWFKLYDANSGELLNTWSNNSYEAAMTVYRSDGSAVYSYTYQNSDVNWISWVPDAADTYRCEVVLTGGWKGSHSTSFTVTPNSYTVYYDANGGWNAPAAQTKHHGQTLVLSESEPVREGYRFMGWGTHAGSTSAAFLPGADYYANESTTLYAIWEINRYRITYDANGGAFSLLHHYKDHGETVSIPSDVPTRSGYTFAGWSKTRNGTPTYSAGSGFGENEDVTLYACWNPNAYTVRYDANGGNGAPSAQTKYHGTALRLSSEAPERLGYVFLGWATGADATQAMYAPGAEYTSDRDGVLYAVWKRDVCVIGSKYVVNDSIAVGGEMKYYSFTPEESGTYVVYSAGDADLRVYLYDANFSELASDDDGGEGRSFRLARELSGGRTYIYGVRFYSSSAVGDFTFLLGPCYRVSYDANSGVNAPSAQSKDFRKDLTLSEHVPVRDGYRFLGWSRTATATYPTYASGSVYSANEDATLYAVWEKLHVHAFDRQIPADQYRVTAATCETPATFCYSCACGAYGSATFAHGALAAHTYGEYHANLDATYTEDGTKTATCERCGERDTVTDLGSALGLDQRFRDEVNTLTAEPTYGELRACLQSYSVLSEGEKREVCEAYGVLLEKASAYNERMAHVNGEHTDAVETAATPLTDALLSLVRALWSVIENMIYCR